MALYPMQLSSSRALHQSSLLGAFSSSCGRDFSCFFHDTTGYVASSKSTMPRVYAMSSDSSPSFIMNLNEYMKTLEKPRDIRFALTVDGEIIVHALKKGGNAEKSRIIKVGDALKKASDSPDGGLVEIRDHGNTRKILEQKAGSFSPVLERPFSPFPIPQISLVSDLVVLFNRGRISVATWNKTILASNLQTCSEGGGHSGFVMFSAQFMNSKGWKVLNGHNGDVNSKMHRGSLSLPIGQLVCILSEESGDVEWSHGTFPLEEYIKALDHSKDELYCNHAVGMRYSKITNQIYVGSCIQTEADVETLSNAVGAPIPLMAFKKLIVP